MNLIISLDSVEEARLSVAADHLGLAPVEYVKKLITENAPTRLDANAGDPTLALFAQWDEEDASITAEELAQEKRDWDAFKSNINPERRRAGSREQF